LARLVDCDRRTLRLRWRFAPPVQGHDTYTEPARDFGLQFPLRRQIICLRQLRRDFHPRVPFLFGHSSLLSPSYVRLSQVLIDHALDCPKKMVNPYRLE